MVKPEHNEGWYLGVDGGGSKTLAVIVDASGALRGQAQVGSSNYRALGLPRALDHLMAAIHQAADQAGCQLPVAGAWLGLASIDAPRDVALLASHLQSVSAMLSLTNDAELLLSALPGMAGIALIAGTGAIALGRNARGETARASGWGHLLGDEGSGYDIGRQALIAAVRAADGRGDALDLLARILDHWKLARPEMLIEKVYRDPQKALIARLAPVVCAAAEAGDTAARHVMRVAADELVASVSAVHARLGFAGPAPLALGGGLLLHHASYRQLVMDRVQQRHLASDITLVDHPALSAARAMAGSAGERTPHDGTSVC